MGNGIGQFDLRVIKEETVVTSLVYPVVLGVREDKKYSINEIFGPTVQGEGPMAGHRTVFVRIHFCDGDGQGHWCSWCDTKYTWDPSNPEFKKFERLTADEIVSRVLELYGRIELYGGHHSNPWITLSGGNPVMQMDDDLVNTLRKMFRVQVETQGTIWKSCLMDCDYLVVSPKPPSSGMADLTDEQLYHWAGAARHQNVAFKVVVFDERDFLWAEDLYSRLSSGWIFPTTLFYLQAGTEQEGEVIDAVIEKYRWLVERSLKSSVLRHAVVLPQLHVLVWGRKRGV